MKSEYEFSKAKRGKLFRKNASLEVPVYLESSVRDYLTERAKAEGVDVGALVNGLLKRQIG
jgi:hypothetical protein